MPYPEPGLPTFTVPQGGATQQSGVRSETTGTQEVSGMQGFVVASLEPMAAGQACGGRDGYCSRAEARKRHRGASAIAACIRGTKRL
jgi:hypothetical protein